MVRGVREGLWSAAGFGVVLIVLAFADERVRSRLSSMFGDPVHGGLTLGAKLSDLADTVGMALREQLLTNTALAVFAIVAAILVWSMVRS